MHIPPRPGECIEGVVLEPWELSIRQVAARLGVSAAQWARWSAQAAGAGLAQGRGIPRSVQIFRTKSSLISLCRGMALRLLSSGWYHQEWLPPSLNRVQPC